VATQGHRQTGWRYERKLALIAVGGLLVVGCGSQERRSASPSPSAGITTAPSPGLHELQPNDPRLADLVTGQLAEPEAIATFFGLDVRDEFATRLQENGAVSATARVWLSGSARVRAMMVTFATADGAATFLHSPDVTAGAKTVESTVLAPKTIPICLTPDGHRVGWARHSQDAGSIREYLGTSNWRADNVDVFLVGESGTLTDMARSMDEINRLLPPSTAPRIGSEASPDPAPCSF
jgi:hypothetical protein